MILLELIKNKMKTKCPYCNYVATEHETLNYFAKPKELDISFCINCGEISKFKNKKLIKESLESLDDATKKEINKIRIAWLKTRSIQSVSKQ